MKKFCYNLDFTLAKLILTRVKAHVRTYWKEIMKINSITTNASILKGRAIGRTPNYERDCEKKRHNINQNYNDQINTTINANKNADGRVSFKGGVPFLHKAAKFASESPLIAEALFALVITCGLRPLTIMATAKTDEDKEKCSYQAAKSVSTGLVGLATSILVGLPIKEAAAKAKETGKLKMPEPLKKQAKEFVNKGVEKALELANNTTDSGLKNQILGFISKDGINLGALKKTGKNATKNFLTSLKEKAPDAYETIRKGLKAQTTIENYESTAKNVIDKFFQPIFMPLRATITIALVPIILTALGLKKSSGKKPQEANINPYQQLNYNVFQNNTEKELFRSFLGGDQ